MKATLPLIFLFATASFLSAQTPSDTVVAQSGPTTAATQEAVRRQASQILLQQKLEAARIAQQRRDLVGAAKLYDDAWALVENIGPGIEVEAQQTVAGLTATRMELASTAQRRADYKEADVQIRDVLRVNSKDVIALEFKRANDRLIEQQRGFIPSPATVEMVPTIRSNKVEAATLVQDGRLLFQLGKLDAAESKLNEALAQEPGNSAALYYVSLIQQSRAKQMMDQRNVNSEKSIVEVERSWTDSVKRETLPVPNPYARTNLVYTSKGRQEIMSKMDSIRFDTVSYPGLPLSEVIKSLSVDARKRDAAKKGVNFLLNSAQPAALTVAPTTPGGPRPPGGQSVNPVTGLPEQAAGQASAEPEDIGAVQIKLDPGLSDVRLADVLEAVVKVADHPIKYSLLDYGIEFSFRGTDTAQLIVRRFKIDPNTFYMGLQNVTATSFGGGSSGGGGGSRGGGGGSRGGGGGGGGGQGGQGGDLGTSIPRVDVTGSGGGNIGGGGRTGGGNVGGAGGAAAGGNIGGGGLRFVTSPSSMGDIQTAVITFFRTVGVDLTGLGKAVFFNDREGVLTVRATADDLDMIEAAVDTLNIAPPEVNIKAKFVEINQNDSRALGFDWYLGKFLMGGGNVVGSAGTQPSLNGANPPLTVFPGNGFVPSTTIPSSTSDGLLTSGLRNSANAPALATFTGILTDPQFRMVLKALEQRDGADLLNEGQVTTLSGRQAQFQVVDIKTIVTGNDTGSQGGGATAAPQTGTSSVIQNSPITVNYDTESQPFGSTLDVVPYVCADGYTIQMTLIPTVTEFVGYDDATAQKFVPQGQISGGQTLTGVLPLPITRVRQVTTSCIVWDGQTIVLGGLITSTITRSRDKVPVLGDLPFAGRLFRSEANSTQKKNLVVFVTPTIIDPAGNRKHSDDEMPFAQASFPSQPAVANP